MKKYFSDNIDDPHRFKSLLATPLIPTAPEMYILGMSERSAKLAGRRGLPFVIAQMGQSSKSIDEVIKVYRMNLNDGMGDMVESQMRTLVIVLLGRLAKF